MWLEIYIMFINPSLTFYFKMFNSQKTVIGTLRCGYTIAYDKMYELHKRISVKQHTEYALWCQYLLLAVYTVEVC